MLLILVCRLSGLFFLNSIQEKSVQTVTLILFSTKLYIAALLQIREVVIWQKSINYPFALKKAFNLC